MNYDASPTGRLLFAFHWCMWKIGKALYQPRLTSPETSER